MSLRAEQENSDKGGIEKAVREMPKEDRAKREYETRINSTERVSNED